MVLGTIAPNHTMHKNSQGRAALAFALFFVKRAFAKAPLPCSPVMVSLRKIHAYEKRLC